MISSKSTKNSICQQYEMRKEIAPFIKLPTIASILKY